jgi:hypothetical protein
MKFVIAGLKRSRFARAAQLLLSSRFGNGARLSEMTAVHAIKAAT